MTSTPDELAKMFSLSAGREKPPIAWLAAEEQEALIDLINEVQQLPISRLAAFRSEFNSKYLLAFMKQFLQALYPPNGNAKTWELQVCLLNTIAFPDTPTISRWVRENPEQARGLYVLLAGATGSMLESNISEDDPEEIVSTFFTHLEALREAGFNLINHLRVLEELPVLDDSIVADLHRLFKHLRTLDLVSNEEGRMQVIGFLEWMVNPGEPQRFAGVRKTLREGGDLVWLRCELPPFSCSEQSKLAGMLACSRCRAVRYCSKEHQKLDWKIHKKICFPPTW